MYPVPPVTNTFICEPPSGGGVSLRSRAPAAKPQVAAASRACLSDGRRCDWIIAYAPPPPLRSKTASAVCLTPTNDSRMCPECFTFVTSRDVSHSGLLFATECPGLPRGVRHPMNVERLPIRPPQRVAILLNANASAVSEHLRRELENF